jgi:Fungal N-terminal domain of STAND proteins
MAEALGIASGAISIVAFAIDATKDILWYYGAWKNQGGDVKEMLASVNDLKGTLEFLQEAIKPPASFPKNVVENVEKSIKSFNSCCNKLMDELKKVQKTEPPKPGVRSAIRLHMRKAMYPFKEATLVKIRGLISEARSNLSLALDTLELFVYSASICLDVQS